MKLRTLLLSAVTSIAVASCGGGGAMFAGGIGGTGVSFGPITAFGSVVVNGVEYSTGSATFRKDGVTTTQAGLATGMVVSVTNDGNGNAKSVSYSDNAEGPVANIGASSFDVLGITVSVDGLTVFAGGLTAIGDLHPDDIVEVSGQITGTNAVLATRVEKKTVTCAAPGTIEVKGTVSSKTATTFMIGSQLVDYSAASPVDAFSDGDYVEVKSGTCPSSNGGTLPASAVENATAGPDLSELDNPSQGELEIKGVVNGAAGSAPDCTFTVNGQAVSTSVSTLIEGAADCSALVGGTSVEAQGQLDTAGTLLASKISVEDSSENSVSTEATGVVTVLSHPSPIQGTITVPGITGTIILDPSIVQTQFVAEEGQSQTFNLDTIAASGSSVCAEVKVNSANIALSIEQKTCP